MTGTKTGWSSAVLSQRETDGGHVAAPAPSKDLSGGVEGASSISMQTRRVGMSD